MKELTITELREICREISPSTFIFDSDNQTYNMDNGTRIISRYSRVIFMLCPNRICFQNDAGILCLSRVKHIKYDDLDGISCVFQIVCGNQSDDSKDISYTILADKNFSE